MLHFKLTGVTPFDLMRIAIEKLDLRKESEENSRIITSGLPAQNVMYDYELLCLSSDEELTLATIFIAFKTMEQMDSGFPAQEKYELC